MAKVIAKTPEGTKVVKLYDVRQYWLYDTEEISNGDTEKFFFQSPEGKTLAQTNLRQFSTIQFGWTFEVYAIRVIPSIKTSTSNLKNLLDTSVLTFYREGDVEVFTAPTVIFPAGAGIYGNTTETDTSILANGMPTPQAVMGFKTPLIIKGGETFNIRVLWSPAVSLTTDVPLKIVLDGILKRPIKGT